MTPNPRAAARARLVALRQERDVATAEWRAAKSKIGSIYEQAMTAMREAYPMGSKVETFGHGTVIVAGHSWGGPNPCIAFNSVGVLREVPIRAIKETPNAPND